MAAHLVFTTEGERFGLPATVIEEVIDAPKIRHLAGMPPHVAGVIFHRGTWLPAIDAAPRLGLQAQSARAAALIVRRGRGRFALTADSVLGIREWAQAGDLGVVTTDLGLVTPVDPNLLFRSEMALDEEESDMPATSTTVSIVVFRMNNEEFGTDISNVVEVLEYREPVHVPRAPEFIDGVVQVRDKVLPIIDLRKRMEIPVAPPTADTRIIVVLIDEERVGLLVDSVVEVSHMRSENVSQPPAFFRGLSAEYLQGLARIGERLVIVLRLERILTSQERIALLRADLTDTDDDDGELTSVPLGDRKRGRRSSR
ncbi:MAG: chemotaxis protein CheW [Gemmatimonadota bacterium]